MRRRTIAALLGLICLIFSATGHAQNDPGVRDTIRINCPVVVPQVPAVGDSFAVPIYVSNDGNLAAYTFAFSYNTEVFKFSSFDTTGTVTRGGILSVQDSTISSNSKVMLFGWINSQFLPPYTLDIPPSQGALLATLYFKMVSASSPITVDLDSVTTFKGFNSFVLTLRTPTQDIVPYMAIECGTTDIRLPVHEYESPVLPESFVLGQNNPNPFNPSTSIDFALPKSANVKVEIFNILGQKVKTLVDEYLSAGYKKVTWDGTDNTGKTVASGVYLYRMTADDFSATKKMMLMK